MGKLRNSTVICALLIAFTFFLSINLFAQPSFDIETKVASSYTATLDGFGSSAAISGDLILIGAREGTNAPNWGPGYASFFEFHNGNWVEQARITASDGQVEDFFGTSVAVDKDVAIVGAPGDDDLGPLSGSAYIYRLKDSQWIEEAKVLSSTGQSDDVFGQSVAIQGDFAVVGSPGDDSTALNHGAVFIYNYDGNAWNLYTRLTADTSQIETYFGNAVALYNNILVVGAPKEYGWQGAVYVFEFDGSTWLEKTKLVSNNSMEGDAFGSSVQIKDDIIVIGAPNDLGPSNSNWKQGAAYIYRNVNDNWVEEAKLFASDGDTYDLFGENVSVDGEMLLIGARGDDNAAGPDAGAAYIFQYEGNTWNEKLKLVAADLDTGDWYGYSSALNNNVAVLGCPWDDDFGYESGSAYIYELIARPKMVEASNGTYGTRLRVGWENRSPSVESFKVYRDGEEIATPMPGARSYNDYDAIQGKIYSYDISAYNSAWGESAKVPATGWRRANGKVSGKIRTSMGAGVSNATISVEPTATDFCTVLRFDGIDDFISIPSSDELSLSRWTIEGWILPQGEGTILWRAPDTLVNYQLRYIAGTQNIEAGFQEDNGTMHAVQTPPNSAPLNQWVHVAAICDSVVLMVYLDGIPAASLPLSPNPHTGQAPLLFGRDSTNYFKGRIGEIRLWNGALDSTELATNMHRLLKGDESGLVAYWLLDDSSRSSASVAADYAEGGGHHGTIYGAEWKTDTLRIPYAADSDPTGYYAVRNIYYDESREFEIVPSKGEHGFDPSIQTRTLETASSSASGIDFTDTTSFSVIGHIRYANSQCNVKDVEILLNGNPTGVKTDGGGQYLLSIEEPGTYTITPSYGDSAAAHAFYPDHVTLSINDDVTGMDFEDLETQLLYGKVRAACNSVIGTAWINLRSIGHNWGLLDTTFATDAEGNFRLFFPAQKYLVDVVNLDPYNPIILQYFNSDTMDLRWANQRKNFIYRTTPVIKISGFEEWGSGVYAVPILEQFANYHITIDVLDVHGTDSCQVDSGTVTIYDDLGGNPSQPQTFILQNGSIEYDILPLKPNILGGGSHPYQKLLQIVAHVGQETASLEQWALITGHRPREQTFSSTTPELPLLILRDPPGDESYCFQAKDSTVNVNFTNSFEYAREKGVFLDARIGAVLSVGFITETSMGAYAMLATDFTEGKELGMESSVLFSLKTTEEFRTSDDNLVVGPKGDVFIGASLNSVYALTDVIDYDFENAQVVLDTSLVWGVEGFNTTYIYTEYHIRNTLLPQLRMLRSLAGGDSAQILKLDAAIEIWEEVLEKNEELKQQATFERNISFSAGTQTTYTSTASKENSISFNYTKFLESSMTAGVGFVIAGVPTEIGYKTRWRWTTSVVQTAQISNSTTIGYTFGDDDPGDYFSVDIKQDRNGFGTPVFQLVAGTSSCPWEEGTQPRDGVELGIDTYVQNNVPPNDPATFILTLGNTSQSGEAREYHLRVIQGSNPDGAVIKIGGVPLGGPLSYFIPAGQQFTAAMTVERGPLAYDYDNLQVMLYPPCQYENWQNNMPIMIADTVTFSAHFVSPCSPVNLLLPEDNWVLNQNDNDTLQFIITDYDINNSYLESVKFQYRRYGENWETAFLYPKSLLPSDYILEYWDVSALRDGQYELRVATDCGSNGVNYSAIAAGVIDRQALVVFGQPQPPDGVLNLGEDISVSFSGDIDCNLIDPQQDVQLFTADDSTQIPLNVSCYQNTLILQPVDSLIVYANRILTARVSGIRDIHGNRLRRPVEWSFRVSTNPVYWSVSNAKPTVYQGIQSQFSRTLKNGGGTDQTFTIQRYPVWLTPAPLSGSIPPGGEAEIQFAIDPLLNPGAYADTVVTTTTQGEDFLFVNLQVLPKPPDWQVNPAQFAYSMNLTVQPTFAGVLTHNVFDRMAVLVGEEVRGVANVEYVTSANKYLAFLTVYSNSTAGESLTFRSWDASEGREYAMLGGGYTFQNNGSLGSVSAPLLIEPDANVQNIDLQAGWNWFSLNVAGTSTTPMDVLAGIPAQNGDLIKGQTAYCQYQEGSGWVGSLNAVEVGRSYCLLLSGEARLSPLGTPVDLATLSIPVDTGWNWIGYPAQQIMEIDQALVDFPASSGDRIKSQDEFSEFSSISGSWEGSLKKLIPGEGYFLFSHTAAQLQYANLNKSDGKTLFYEQKPEWVVDVSRYEYTACLTAVLDFDEKEMADSTILLAAFSRGECRGVVPLQRLPGNTHFTAFLMLYADSAAGDTLSFRVYDAPKGVVRDAPESLVFTADQIWGNPAEPYRLTALPIGDELVPYDFYLQPNYPNPFNPVTTIEYGLPRDVKVQLVVFNALGQKVKTLVNSRRKAGRYAVEWNATRDGLATGVYFYRLKAGSFEKTRKLLLVK